MTRNRQVFHLRTSVGVLWAAMAVIVSSASSMGQSTSQVSVDKVTLQSLLERVAQLEARVRQLEAGRPAVTTTASSSQPVTAAPASTQAAALLAEATNAVQHPAASSATPPQSQPESSQAETAMSERMDVSKTLLRIRGFGDVSFHGDTQHGDTTSFSLGQLDLFVTSDLSESFRFLSEIVFEGGPNNIYGTIVGPENSFSVDVERYLLQYSLNDHLNLSVGRGHTAIGYYNNAYHHSTWMQTTVDRPFLFEFEDRGGILPIHIVGASASGMIPSGPVGLHYVAEIGNGRETRDPLNNEPVQNVITDDNHKAFNIAAFARPESVPGFQAGISVYRDELFPDSMPKIGETIVAAHAILIRSKYEWLSEALLDRHAPMGSPIVFHTPGFYAQMSRQFGLFRPYLRYEYLNVPPHEPVFADIALRHGPLAGIRFDPNESVALKLQFSQTFLRNQPSVTGLTGQVGFTF